MYKPLTNARLYVDPQIERLLVEIWRKKSFEKAFASWSTNLWHKLKKKTIVHQPGKCRKCRSTANATTTAPFVTINKTFNPSMITCV